MSLRLVILFLFSLFIANIQDIFAQTLDNVYKDWSVYTITQNGQKICYTASTPDSSTGNFSKRDEPYVIVTYIDKNTDQISVVSGYKYKKNSEVAVEFGKSKQFLYTNEDIAWAPDSESDAKTIAAMRSGLKMKVRGTSTKGTYSLDTYSLNGFTAAYNRMKQLCK